MNTYASAALVQNCDHKKLQTPYHTKARSLVFRIKKGYLIFIKRLQSLHSLLLIFWRTTGEKVIHIHDAALSPALKQKSLKIITYGRIETHFPQENKDPKLNTCVSL